MEYKNKNIRLAPEISGIRLKKQFGQHFLQDQSVVDTMLNSVNIGPDSSVFEIGSGNGFLTKAILKYKINRLWIFEIDIEWANYIKQNYPDPRITMFNENFLDTDLSMLNNYKPWLLLANLPYQVTFPILYKLIIYRDLLEEAVVMIQEEVAQKIVKSSGRGYGFNSLYLQHFFDFRLLVKIPASSFYPAPKVTSRLIYFKPLKNLDFIREETGFWKFIKQIFSQPRRTIKNSLASYHYNLSKVSPDILGLRAQQLSKKDLVNLWEVILNS